MGEITFTKLEIDWLRIEAEKKRTELREKKIYPKRVYEEERHQFIIDYMRGAEPASSVKQQKWLTRIKRECQVKIK